MKYVENPPRAAWPELLKRPVMDTPNLDATVMPVLEAVRREGDAAVRRFTQLFDGVALDTLFVSKEETAQGTASLDEDLKAAIQTAANNIRTFHHRQYQPEEPIETMPGVLCWRRSTPIERVGLYIPGGSAPLFSTVLMLGIPAQLAGCSQIVLCTPPRKDGTIHPAILFAASLVDVTHVVKAGGAQAIAAMAYGTESIPAAYKVFGPGNQYVTSAKQLVSRQGVAIDMPAGPSEVLVCADDTADPEFVAADLLSQAEHGPDSQVVLVAFNTATVERVKAAIDRQLPALPRRDIAAQALQHSIAIVMENEYEALHLINFYAPEHLILAVEHPEVMAAGVINAGSVFLGHYSPESVGDYASGTNHTLPTNGYARAYSGVSLDSFLKKITFQQLSPNGLRNIGPTVERMAEAEELQAHRAAVALRLQALERENQY